jgi:hypothetical protein
VDGTAVCRDSRHTAVFSSKDKLFYTRPGWFFIGISLPCIDNGTYTVTQK